MEIFWYGHSCFRLTERGLATVVVDPFDSKAVGYFPLKLKADIVAISHDAPGHNYINAAKGANQILTGPGEYEIGGVFINAVQTDGHGKKKDEYPCNTLYVFDYDGLTVAHLGDLKQVPTQSEIEALGNVNVVLIPVGGGGGLNAAKAAEIISLLEPNIIIPMHYKTRDVSVPLDSLDKFLKEMGLQPLDTVPSLKITKSALPSESRVIVLDYQRG
jgi:L-ascorbate metabolism protein UlaG (beta-lactamase superfamily)